MQALEKELTEWARVKSSSQRSPVERGIAKQNAHNLLYEYSMIQWEASATRMRSDDLSRIFEGQRLTSIHCKDCGRYAASEAEPFTVEEVKLGSHAQASSWFSQLGSSIF